VRMSSDFAGGLIGTDTEAGEFDPLGLSAGKSEETLAWYRAAELKHGRVCMLAGEILNAFVLWG
jgi:Chlorophyll A-B binding protein